MIPISTVPLAEAVPSLLDWTREGRVASHMPSRHRIRCELCPKLCELAPGERGECRIRVHLDGELRAVTYGLPSAVHLDPIEKKPLNHFHPGGTILSLATAGCNLHCRFCQNWSLSQADPETIDNSALSPAAIVDEARRLDSRMVAFTYAEPLVFFEYTLDGFRAARQAGIETVLVTAGYGNAAPLRELFAVTSATNIDLKAFNDRFYREVCDGTLAPVLDALVLARECGVWLEVTWLVVPTLNDDPAEMQRAARWMVAHLGADVPLHLSRFHPQHKLTNLPPTPAGTLARLRDAARGEGLRYVYVGNVLGSEDQHTRCPRCGERLVERVGYRVTNNLLGGGRGACPRCGEPIAGVWEVGA